MTISNLQFFYVSHILPHISFSSTVRDGCGEIYLNKLNSLHRRTVKSYFRIKKKIINRRKIESPWYFTIPEQLDFRKAVLMFKVNRKMTPSYIISLFRKGTKTRQICITKAPSRPVQDQSIHLRFFLLEYAAISHQNRWNHQTL